MAIVASSLVLDIIVAIGKDLRTNILHCNFQPLPGAGGADIDSLGTLWWIAPLGIRLPLWLLTFEWPDRKAILIFLLCLCL